MEGQQQVLMFDTPWLFARGKEGIIDTCSDLEKVTTHDVHFC